MELTCLQRADYLECTAVQEEYFPRRQGGREEVLGFGETEAVGDQRLHATQRRKSAGDEGVKALLPGSKQEEVVPASGEGEDSASSVVCTAEIKRAMAGKMFDALGKDRSRKDVVLGGLTAGRHVEDC